MIKKLLILFAALFAFQQSHAQCNNLIISEYIEGSSNNKAIEIYNPTSFAVPLTGNIALRIYFNGSLTPTTFNLTGMLSPFSTHVFAHASSDPAILAVADQTTGSPLFNGDDAIELYNVFLATPIDVIGVIGVDPGTEWTVNGVSGTAEHTLIRNAAIQSPNLTWTGSGETEWTVLPQNTFTNLGSHTMDPCGPMPLSVDFTYTDVCFGTLAQFNAYAIGGDGVYTYAWDFGDGVGTSTLENPTYMYNAPGSYTVTVIVTDGTMAVASNSHTIQVFDKPVVSASPDLSTGCAPLTVCFTTNASGGSPVYTFNWSFGDGNVSTQQNPCTMYTVPGSMTAEVIVTDQNGCSDTAYNVITVLAIDDPSFNYPSSSYCINDTDPVPNITGTTGGTFSGTGVNATTGELDLSVAGAGTHTITYTTNGTCSASSQVNVDITLQYDATITPAGPFCELGVPSNLTAVDAGGTWSGNGIIDANLGTFDASAAGVGMHTITYTISGACGDTDTEQIEVLANENVAINNSDTSICNDIFGFFLSANAGGVWSGNMVSDNGNGSGFFSSAAISAGVYYAVYTIPGQCGDADSIAIAVSGTPTASFSFTTNLGTATFTNTSSGAVSYFWDFDGQGTSTQQNPSFTFNLNGTYNVCLTVTNSSGCQHTVCQLVTITGVGIHEQPDLNSRIYPNPSKGNFTIESNARIKTVTVKNLLGQTVYSKNVNGMNVMVALDDTDTGFYFIELETENGKAVKRIEIIK